jgi:hypothetical protein
MAGPQKVSLLRIVLPLRIRSEVGIDSGRRSPTANPPSANAEPPPGFWNKLWRDWDTSSKDGSPQGCSTLEPLPGSLNYPWVLKDGLGILQSSVGSMLGKISQAWVVDWSNP